MRRLVCHRKNCRAGFLPRQLGRSITCPSLLGRASKCAEKHFPCSSRSQFLQHPCACDRPLKSYGLFLQGNFTPASQILNSPSAKPFKYNAMAQQGPQQPSLTSLGIICVFSDFVYTNPGISHVPGVGWGCGGSCIFHKLCEF